MTGPCSLPVAVAQYDERLHVECISSYSIREPYSILQIEIENGFRKNRNVSVCFRVQDFSFQ